MILPNVLLLKDVLENRDHYLQLLEKYRDNRCSPEEVELLLGYFRKNSPEQEQIMELVLAELQQVPSEEEFQNKNIEHNIDQAYLTISREIENTKTFKNRSTRMLWTRILGAAMILIIAGVSYLYFFNGSQKHSENQNIADVKPGHSGATLTLADGKKISLNEVSAGTIASESDINVSKTINGEIIYTASGSLDGANSNLNTLCTANGETYQIVLSDGTKVWLNAATTLQYSVNLREQGKRIVRLVAGEAYFEVAKDKSHPFVVKTAKQEVEVLGTHFNINSYVDEGKMVTTLAEGSVKIKEASDLIGVVLKPNQQAVSFNGSINVQEADLQTALAWKDNKIYFRDATIQEVLRQVSRWYNIKVEYKGVPTKEVFNGGIKRSANLSSVLHILELSNVQFSLKKNNNVTTLTVIQEK